MRFEGLWQSALTESAEKFGIGLFDSSLYIDAMYLQIAP